jgi:hypothetical protein
MSKLFTDDQMKEFERMRRSMAEGKKELTAELKRIGFSKQEIEELTS